jgi:hypothetical protein
MTILISDNSLLHPLQEFQVVLEPAFDQALDRDGVVNLVLVENGLQYFVVLNVFVLVLGSEFDLGEGYLLSERC